MQTIKLILIAATVFCSAQAGAQALYKYIDKDGKVSYTDRVPKPGEKAELVKIDSQTNILNAPKNTVAGSKQTIQDVNARGKAMEASREQLQQEVEGAKRLVADAKKARETGETPLEDEKQIVALGKGAVRTVLKESYVTRIAELDKNIKDAEQNLEKAEEKYNRNRPN